MLTKKDFIKVAEILNKNLNENKLGKESEIYGVVSVKAITYDLIKWFKSENKDFNEDKFRRAVLKE